MRTAASSGPAARSGERRTPRRQRHERPTEAAPAHAAATVPAHGTGTRAGDPSGSTCGAGAIARTGPPAGSVKSTSRYFLAWLLERCDGTPKRAADAGVAAAARDD